MQHISALSRIYSWHPGLAICDTTRVHRRQDSGERRAASRPTTTVMNTYTDRCSCWHYCKVQELATLSTVLLINHRAF